MKLLRSFLLCLLCCTLRLTAETVEMSALENLPTVGVTVRGLSSDGAKLGLTESALIATVRGVIEPAGLKVLPPPVLERTPTAAVLEISANVSLNGKTSYFYILDLQLREPVKPLRKLQTLVTVPAVTWSEQTGGVTARAEKVQEALARLAQQFADEWSQAQGATKP